MAVLVCGIVPSAPAHPPATLRLVQSGMLAAAVHDLPDDAALSDEDAELYFDGLVELLARGPVLPVRFGTVAPDDHAVCRELLDPAGDELAERLDLLKGLVEVRINVELDAADETRRLVGASPTRRRRWRASASASLEDRIEIGQEIGEVLGELRDLLGDQLVERLGDLAIAHAQVRSDEVTELRHAYLIRADDLAAFDHKVQELRASLPACSIEYVGPLPPFEFTDVDLGVTTGERSRWGF